MYLVASNLEILFMDEWTYGMFALFTGTLEECEEFVDNFDIIDEDDYEEWLL